MRFADNHAKLPFVNDTRDLLSELSLWRRPQDSNLQALSGQLLSRQLPHHPDRRHIGYWEVLLLLLVTNISPAVRNLDRRPRNIWLAREPRLELRTQQSKCCVIPFHHSRIYGGQRGYRTHSSHKDTWFTVTPRSLRDYLPIEWRQCLLLVGHGGYRRTRTFYPYIKSVVLYRMSYVPI